MNPVWRLILDPALDGGLNMALDLAAQTARQAGIVPPTLRLYRWARPTVTLGRFQSDAEVDLEAARRRGCDVVRRQTGGRGVLHSDEVTYSVTASVCDGIPRGVTASYRLLSQALADAYRALGAEAVVGQGQCRGGRSSACYLTSTRADLAFAGRKLSGSAQVWTGDTLLQHGSVVRSRDVQVEAEVLRLDDDDRDALLARTVTLADLVQPVPDHTAIEAALVSAFERTLGLRLRLGQWTPYEGALISRRLVAPAFGYEGLRRPGPEVAL